MFVNQVVGLSLIPLATHSARHLTVCDQTVSHFACENFMYSNFDVRDQIITLYVKKRNGEGFYGCIIGVHVGTISIR